MSTYFELLEHLKQHQFLSPTASNLHILESLVATALRTTSGRQGQGPYFGEQTVSLHPPSMESCVIPSRMATDVPAHIEALPAFLAGTVKSNHPRMVKNMIPTPTLTYLASYIAASIYMGNAVTSEDAGKAALAEIQLWRMYARLAGYDATKAGGVFTFGGTGTNMYAIRMGILGVDPRVLHRGISQDLVVIGSRSAHYSQQNVVSWIGLGRDRYLAARSHPDQTTDIDDLERLCREQIERGRKIACIVGVGGSTSCMGIDDFSQLSALVDRLVEDYALPYRPHLHADSVIGWAYLHFVTYDFDVNPLSFRDETLFKLQKITERISTLRWADSFGIDFHKTGFVPYMSSMLIVKSMAKLTGLGHESDMITPLFHDAIAYNPGKYTLETSRSSANMVATLMSVTALGLEGFQCLLGHAQDISLRIRSYMKAQRGNLLVVNPDTAGSDIFVRVYPRNYDAATTFKAEAADPALRRTINEYNNAFFQFLSAKCTFGQNSIAVGKTSAAFYDHTGEPIGALRLYILNPFLDPKMAKELVDTLTDAKSVFDFQSSPVPAL
jgi:L-2,4-diaminobutyrate decarboxylase